VQPRATADALSCAPRNWDWKAVAVDLLIVLEIEASPETSRPAIKMMTEAGVVRSFFPV
jgi:hypothetical protein